MPEQGAFMSNRHVSAVDLAVIGAGAIGLTIAWQARRRGLSVVVLERHDSGRGTSWLAAGMIAPVAEAVAGEEPLLELGLASAGLYPGFVAELEATAGESVDYVRAGTLLLARDEDEAQGLERELALRNRLGLAVERLRPSTARRLEPALAPGLRLALSAPADHAVDPRRLTAALRTSAVAAGVDLREGTAASALLRSGARVSGVRLDDGSELGAGATVLSAGVWAGQIEGLEPWVNAALRPVKGQIMRLRDPGGPGLVTRVLRMSGAYIAPRDGGRYVLGATVEERGFDTTVTAGAAFALLREVGELIPGISELVIDEFAAGLRPGTSDNLPLIGPVSGAPGLHLALGHGRSGILLAPITAELVVDELLGRPVPDFAGAFAPERFALAGSTA
jgi:glycine oxidase